MLMLVILILHVDLDLLRGYRLDTITSETYGGHDLTIVNGLARRALLIVPLASGRKRRALLRRNLDE